MLLVRDLKTAGTNLPDRFLSLLPEDCDACGYPMSITPVLTSLSCSNNRCPSKLVSRVLAMLEQLGIKGIGESLAESYVQEKQVVNPLSLLWLGKHDTLTERISWDTWEGLYNQIERVVAKGFYPWEVVQLLNIKGVQTSAEKLFSGEKTIPEVLEEIEEGGVSYVQEKLGISADGAVSIRATEIYSNLLEAKEDLLEAVQNLPIREVRRDLETLIVVCSSKVGAPYTTKKSFADDMEARFGQYVNLNFKGSLTKSTDFLVWEGADGTPAAWTSKAQTAKKWKEQNPDSIEVVTSQGFIAAMERKFGL